MRIFDTEKTGMGHSFLYIGMLWLEADTKWLLGVRNGWKRTRLESERRDGGSAWAIRPATFVLAAPFIYLQVGLPWVPIRGEWEYAVDWCGGFIGLTLKNRAWYLRMPYTRCRHADPRKPLPASAIRSPSRGKEFR